MVKDDGKFRLQVWFERHWRWGIVEYPSYEEAEKRVARLAEVGIKARIRKNFELFDGGSRDEHKQPART